MISDPPSASGPDLAALNLFLESLHDADWEDPRGVIRFNNNTPLAELGAADFLQNTRVFLQALTEENGTAATVTGNLNRVFVRQMFEKLKLSPSFRASTLSVCKVINEMDLWPLHKARIVAELGRLVAKRNGHQGEWPGLDDKAVIRTSSLFRQFVAFPKSWSPWPAV